MANKASGQVTVVDITDAYSVLLTSESYTFVGNTTGAPSGLSCITQVVAYCGAQQCSKVSVSTVTCPTGISATVTNNNTASPTITFKTTATITAACEATIPVVVDGVTINKKFSFAVAKQGGTGSAGKGIKSTAITYQAGSSGTTAPTGTWVSSPPKTTAAAPYMWTKTVITYTDNTTSTSYSVGSTPEGIQVGGRNLLHGSKMLKNDCKDFYSVLSTVNDKYGDFVCSKTNSAWQGPAWDISTIMERYGLEPGDTLTYSIMVMVDFVPDKPCSFSLYRAVTTASIAVATITMEKDKWYKLSISFTLNESSTTATHTRLETNYYKTAGDLTTDNKYDFEDGYMYFAAPKLEVGNVATDWTPAPEDALDSVDVEYYLSTSATSLVGGSWSTTAPAWVNGKYMWSRTVKTDGAGNKTYSPSQNGVCIAGAKGDTGAAGKGITSIVEQYYKSTSATSLAGGSWSTTAPTWEDGKYIWTRSAITYTDSSTPVYTTAICTTGQKGATGATGATGNGISKITEHYAVSTSNTTAPTTWYDTLQTMTATNKYLWNYETVTYTNNTTSDTTKRVIGVYGDKGDKGNTGSNGKSIGSIINYYLATSSSSGVTTGTSGWTTTVQSVSASKKYLWNYEVIKYTDGTTASTSAPCIIGAYGDTGSTGATGKSVSSVTPQYYISTSKTSATGGSWSDTAPTTVAKGKYLWTRMKVVYTNPSSTAYTTATYDSMTDSRIEQLKDSITLEITGPDGVKSSIAMDDDGKIALTGDVMAQRINVDELMAKHLTSTGGLDVTGGFTMTDDVFEIIKQDTSGMLWVGTHGDVGNIGVGMDRNSAYLTANPKEGNLETGYGFSINASGYSGIYTKDLTIKKPVSDSNGINVKIEGSVTANADHNLINTNHTNEFNFVPSGYSDTVWINYRTQGGTNGNISNYKFGKGAGDSYANIQCAGVNASSISLSSGLMTDYVVAQGWSGVWYYRKWASGRAECWGYQSKTITIPYAYGSGVCYGSDQFGSISYPFTISYYRPFVTPHCASASVWLGSGTYDGSNNNSPAYRVFYAQALNSSTTITMWIYVSGFWK